MLAGEIVDNPGELLQSERFLHLLDYLKNKFDIIIIDSPPLLYCADAIHLAKYVNYVILTTRYKYSKFSQISEAHSRLWRVNKNIGIVANAINSYNNMFHGMGYAYTTST